VIAARPTERRLMLEEAAGISGLHARRKDAEQKLRATEANLLRLVEIMGDQEARAAALRRQARAASRYRDLTDKIRLAEARLVFAKWSQADRAASAASEEARLAEGEVARLQKDMLVAQNLQEHAATALATRRDAALVARDQGRNLAHQLATARAARDTAVRRLAELDRLGLALAADTERERSLDEDARRAVETLEAERAAIEARLADAETVGARIAAELTAAEAQSRQVEARLAGLLASEAAMRAERRVADAAIEAAKGQSARVVAEQRRLAAQIAALGDGASEREAIKAARAAGEEAAKILAEAEAQLAAAETGRSEAAEARDAGESALGAARAKLSAATSERDALARALAGGGAAALANVRAAPGFERALAAALGDDLDAEIGGAGPRRWDGSEPRSDDPELPAGVSPLADAVGAPAALKRRLAQVGVVDRDEGQALAVGQRLVTRDGAMRRWDGFVSQSGGAAAADRLLRINRLAELEQALPALDEATKAALAARDEASLAVDNFRTAADEARKRAAAAERAMRDSTRAVDLAQAALERLDGQRAQFGERMRELDPLASAAAEALASAEAAAAALPIAETLEAEVAKARRLAARAGEAVAEARAASASRARETAADRERNAAAGREAIEWRGRAARAQERLAEAAERQAALAAERAELADQPAQQAISIEALERDAAASEGAVATSAGAERDAEQAVSIAAQALATTGEAFAAAREARAGAAARAEAQASRRREYARISGERFECPPPLLPERIGFDAATLNDPDEEKNALDRWTNERERIGPVNLIADQELAELDGARLAAVAERDELGQAISRLRGSIGSLNREGRLRLLAAFEQVDGHFRRLFTTLFEGGQAHLELVESDDPLEAGLEIMAQPPGKRLSSLTLLSGGEQALTAVALIFALFLTNPAPICVLDEVDAPLDDANVERFCDLLDVMSQATDTRYLIVTHNAVTMSRMHRLYGVTMIEAGVSRLVSVDLGGAERLLAAE
jgi:chromosome segregation protein